MSEGTIIGRREGAAAVKECAPEEGVIKAMEVIENLLRRQDYVVVTIVGSGTDVGKTYTSSRLEGAMIEKDISFTTVNNVWAFCHLIAAPIFRDSGRPGHVLIFNASSATPSLANGRQIEDGELRKQAQRLGLPIKQVDLRIYVYRPGKPFYPDTDLSKADIIIRNDAAVDKSKRP